MVWLDIGHVGHLLGGIVVCRSPARRASNKEEGGRHVYKAMYTRPYGDNLQVRLQQVVEIA